MKATDIEYRDWLAAQALIGIMASPLCPPMQPGSPPAQHADRMAKLAYEFADAMMRVAAMPKPLPGSAQGVKPRP